MPRSLIFILSLFFLTACHSDKDRALAYNDTIIHYQIQLVEKMDSINSLIEKKDTTTAHQKVLALQKNVREWIPQLLSVDTIPGGANMKYLMLDLLKYYDGLLASAYPGILAVAGNDTTSVEDIKAQLMGLQLLEMGAMQIEKQLREAQDSLIEKYNIRVSRVEKSE
ncbi:MAG: hypothetical protein EBS07_05045 [Sphingobacteriia bacterium]|nr:hypothetical protein [Sphingobacteriia bacterium]